jgi:two-component system LytT family response regulator
MKPIDRRRFHDAIARAKRLVAHDDASDRREPLAQLVASLAAGTAATPPLTRLALKSEGKITFLKVADISWIEAADDYVRLHVGRDAHLHRDTIARLAARLPASSFLRIHRSTIVNVDMIRELQPWFQGDYVLILKDGTRLTSGRSYRDAVRRLVDEAR